MDFRFINFYTSLQMHITVHCSLLDLAALRGYYLAYVRLIGVFKMKIFSKDSLAFSSKKQMEEQKTLNKVLCYLLLHNFLLRRSLYQKKFSNCLIWKPTNALHNLYLTQKVLFSIFWKNEDDLAYLRVTEDKMWWKMLKEKLLPFFVFENFFQTLCIL